MCFFVDSNNRAHCQEFSKELRNKQKTHEKPSTRNSEYNVQRPTGETFETLADKQENRRSLLATMNTRTLLYFYGMMGGGVFLYARISRHPSAVVERVFGLAFVTHIPPITTFCWYFHFRRARVVNRIRGYVRNLYFGCDTFRSRRRRRDVKIKSWYSRIDNDDN